MTMKKEKEDRISFLQILALQTAVSVFLLFAKCVVAGVDGNVKVAVTSAIADEFKLSDVYSKINDLLGKKANKVSMNDEYQSRLVKEGEYWLW
jgi:hypothetical protein